MRFNFMSSKKRNWILFLFLHILTQGHFFHCFWEREKHHHDLVVFRDALWTGIEPVTWVCALMGNQTQDLSVYGTRLQPTEPLWPGWGGNGFVKVTTYLWHKWQLLHIVIFAFHRILNGIMTLSVYLCIYLPTTYHLHLDLIHFYPGP